MKKPMQKVTQHSTILNPNIPDAEAAEEALVSPPVVPHYCQLALFVKRMRCDEVGCEMRDDER